MLSFAFVHGTNGLAIDCDGCWINAKEAGEGFLLFISKSFIYIAR